MKVTDLAARGPVCTNTSMQINGLQPVNGLEGREGFAEDCALESHLKQGPIVQHPLRPTQSQVCNSYVPLIIYIRSEHNLRVYNGSINLVAFN